MDGDQRGGVRHRLRPLDAGRSSLSTGQLGLWDKLEAAFQQGHAIAAQLGAALDYRDLSARAELAMRR